MANEENIVLPEAQPQAAAPEALPEKSVPTSPSAGKCKRILDWLLLPSALQKAREEDANVPEGRRAILAMARAHAELADALLDAGDNLYLAPILTLYREACLWLLAKDEADKRSLVVALETSPELFLAHQEGTPAAGLRNLLVMQFYLGADKAPTEELRHFGEMTRAAVRSTLDQLSAPEPNHHRTVLRKRRWRVAFASLILVAGLSSVFGFGIILFPPKDLALGQPWHTSSALSARFTAKIMFHTNEELNPWFEIDFGRPRSVHRLSVENRKDCCQERAIPLVVEISLDRSKWHQVARRDSPFDSWEPSFSPAEARYVRLRVLRFTALHLEHVSVY